MRVESATGISGIRPTKKWLKASGAIDVQRDADLVARMKRCKLFRARRKARTTVVDSPLAKSKRARRLTLLQADKNTNQRTEWGS
mmetsp:Transcript_9093/g.21650  ORF Transcript_9093/g.21650 Transcript_9093/m.21650 type:complete len:85 (+) Transcript_9093:363-617(+)